MDWDCHRDQYTGIDKIPLVFIIHCSIPKPFIQKIKAPKKEVKFDLLFYILLLIRSVSEPVATTFFIKISNSLEFIKEFRLTTTFSLPTTVWDFFKQLTANQMVLV